MDKKKKMIILILSIIIILVIIGIIIVVIKNKNSNINNEEINNNKISDTKLSKIYDKLENMNTYCFSQVIDDNNKKITYVTENTAYQDEYKTDKHLSYIVKDEKTYILSEEDKTCYEYNNVLKLGEITNNINEILESGVEPVTGSEKIDNKNYNYEEYKGTVAFLINGGQAINYDKVSTRFYFNRNNLVYIKTILENGEELSKVEITNDKLNENWLEIPSDYEIK